MFSGPAEALPSAKPATSPTNSDREEAMFGSETSSTSGGPVTGPMVPEREDLLGARTGVVDRMMDRLSDQDDTLDLGGRLSLQLFYGALSEGALKDFPVNSPSFLDFFADTRPNERIRAFVSARLTHDFTIDSSSTDFLGQPQVRSRMALDQLWVKFDLWRKLWITAGQQRVRWGVGRLWQAIDFLNPQRLNPLAFFDLRLGVGMIKAHLPIESLGWNFYAILNLDSLQSASDLGGAFRAEFVLGPSELALSFAKQGDGPYRLGFDASVAVWLFDLKAELGLQRGLRTPFLSGTPNPDPMEDILTPDPGPDCDPLPVPVTFGGVNVGCRANEWIPQLVLSAEIAIKYTDEDTIILGAEYFYNNAGYSDERLYTALITQGQFNPLYVSQHYAAAFILLLAPFDFDDTSINLSWLGSLSDRSFLVRLDYSVQVLTFLSVRFFANYYFGASGALRPRISIQPRMDFPGLENGLSIAPRLFDVSAALVVNF